MPDGTAVRSLPGDSVLKTLNVGEGLGMDRNSISQVEPKSAEVGSDGPHGVWKYFEDDFAWLHFEPEGLRKHRHTNHTRWRMELAAAIWRLNTWCRVQHMVPNPQALRRYGCSDAGIVKSRDGVRELGKRILALGKAGKLPGWREVVLNPPAPPLSIDAGETDKSAYALPLTAWRPVHESKLTAAAAAAQEAQSCFKRCKLPRRHWTSCCP